MYYMTSFTWCHGIICLRKKDQRLLQTEREFIVLGQELTFGDNVNCIF